MIRTGFLLGVLFLAGCSSGPANEIPLVLISPHRDEMKYEYDRAYPAWLARRTHQGIDRALSALEEAGLDAVREAMEDVLDDWDRADVAPVVAAYESWKMDPQAAASDLRRALTMWRDSDRHVRLVWQDVGGGTSAIARYIRSSYRGAEELGKQGIGVDLVFGGGTDVYYRFADDGFLQRVELPPQVLERIPAELNGIPMYDPKHLWYGPMLSSFGILSNRWVLERMNLPEPTTWADLGQPRFLGWISAGDPRMSGSIHMVYEIILQGPLGWTDGFELLMRMGANTHTFVRDSGTLTRTVNDGEVAAAGNLDVNGLSAVGRNPRMMAYSLPHGQTIINPDAIAVLRGSERPRLARSFVRYTLSEDGQKLLMLRPGLPGGPTRYAMCRLSVIPALYRDIPPDDRATGDVDPFAIQGSIRYDSKLGIRRWDALNDLLGAWIIDAHSDLVRAARAVQAAPLDIRPELERILYAPPCGEEDLFTYAQHLADGDVRFRAMRLTQWGKEARERYRGVVGRCGR